jgi:hypothetical protein
MVPKRRGVKAAPTALAHDVAWVMLGSWKCPRRDWL